MASTQKKTTKKKRTPPKPEPPAYNGLARLVGGAAITETTLAGARELLATALARKERDLGCGQR